METPDFKIVCNPPTSHIAFFKNGDKFLEIFTSRGVLTIFTDGHIEGELDKDEAAREFWQILAKYVPEVLRRTARWPVNVVENRDGSQNWKEALRISDKMPCEVCGIALFRHGKPLPETCPTMIEDCDGRWWKT